MRKLARGCGDSWERHGESPRSGAKAAKWRDLAAKLGAKGCEVARTGCEGPRSDRHLIQGVPVPTKVIDT